MALGNPSAYRQLATSAAAALGTSSSAIIDAILAQWTCEQPANTWPPVHNNPGFVTVGAMSSVGVVTSPATSSPGAGFLASFPSAAAGAQAYATLIARGRRYAATRAAAARGDGPGYIAAITAAGYGTRRSCADAAYAALGGQAGSGPASSAPAALNLLDLLPPSIRPTGTTTADQLAARDRYKAALAAAGISTADDYRLTQADADKLATAWRWPSAARLKGTINGLVYQSLGQPNSLVPGFTEAANQNIADALTGLASTLTAWLGGAAVGLALLALILILAYAGVRRLLPEGA